MVNKPQSEHQGFILDFYLSSIPHLHLSLSLRPFIPCILLFSSVFSYHDTACITLFTISPVYLRFLFLSLRRSLFLRSSFVVYCY